MVYKEKYKRLIKLVFAAVTLLGICSIFSISWIFYYNKYVLQFYFFRKGNYVVIGIYATILLLFLSLYGGFKIGFLRKSNLLYSQSISLVFTNIVIYFLTAIIDHKFLMPTYMIQVTMADEVFILLWTFVSSKIYSQLFPRRRMIFIEGDRDDYHLMDLITSRKDKYEICERISCDLSMNEIAEKIQQYEAVIIGDMPSQKRNDILKCCYALSLRTYIVPKVSDIVLKNSEEMNLFDTPLFLSRDTGFSIDLELLKRLEDLLISSVMLILFSPVFLIAMVAIKLTDNGPVFYKQERLTKDRKHFQVYKFRTMIVDAEKYSGAVLASENDPRITSVGKILRATRMDELPQILNILKGDMSVVGPRPERPILAEEIEKEIPEFAYRLKVKAGLTGFAQIYGKYNTSSYDKLKLDMMYITRYSILLDLKLILMTPKIMFMKESTEGIKADEAK